MYCAFLKIPHTAISTQAYATRTMSSVGSCESVDVLVSRFSEVDQEL